MPVTSAPEEKSSKPRAIFCMAMLLISSGAMAAGDDDLIFAPKSFYDSGKIGIEGGVHVSGTLTGPEVGYKNNTYSISCIKDQRACFYTSIEQIGPKQLGRMEGIGIIPIVKWDANEVVAKEEDNSFSCARVMITISRRTERVFWLVEPTNQSTQACAKSGTSVMRWTIENSLSWQKINRR